MGQLGEILAGRLDVAGHGTRFDETALSPATRLECSSWRLTASGNGVAFEDKFAERILLPFERLHGQAEYPGTGIGLAGCRRIVEQRHGGSLTVKRLVGLGSTFVLDLPIRHEKAVSVGGSK